MSLVSFIMLKAHRAAFISGKPRSTWVDMISEVRVHQVQAGARSSGRTDVAWNFGLYSMALFSFD